MTEKVNHPAHYNAHPSGIECIDVVEWFSFNLGNAVKYLWRAGLKSDDAITDLKKAKWYVAREIERLRQNSIVQQALDVSMRMLNDADGGLDRLRFDDKTLLSITKHFSVDIANAISMIWLVHTTGEYAIECLADAADFIQAEIDRHALSPSANNESAPVVIRRDAIDRWFELTYAQYLTIPRSVLQSMPDD